MFGNGYENFRKKVIFNVFLKKKGDSGCIFSKFIQKDSTELRKTFSNF